MDSDDFFRIVEDIIAAAPELGILYIIADVRSNNIASGRNTTRPGLSSPGLAITAVPAAQLQNIAKAINQSEGAAASFIGSVAKTLGTDAQTAANWIASHLGI